MRHRAQFYFFFAFFLWSTQALAGGRLIVRINGGLPIAKAACLLAGCTVTESLDGALGQVFLVTPLNLLNLNTVLQVLSNAIGVVDVEPDLVATLVGSARDIPPALSDKAPVNYHGATVPEGYVNQPAAQIIRLPDASAMFRDAAGAGVVAVIDTGVDPSHPALAGVLLPGYDFTRNRVGADEKLDVNMGGTLPAAASPPVWTSPNTAANVSQSTAAVVDGSSQYGDFGHGTMVAGVVHLAAPTAKILPLKAFHSDGTGYTSDILRAIYYAIAQHANIVNMSFTLPGYSLEVATALNMATATGMVLVAAAGNDGQQEMAYPAALWDVMGVASTNDNGQLSTFSNYGPQLVWVAAPGEGVVTTYPFSTYAAGWGTSFSAPFVSGAAARLLSINRWCDQYASSQATSHAQPMNPNAGHGQLDVFQTLEAWSQMAGQ